MPHWKSIHIERFRRLEGVRLEELGVVNILVGRNNCGKTSILEALAIASDPMNVFTWIDTGRDRELKPTRTPVLEILSWFFPHLQPQSNGFHGNISLCGELANGEALEIKAGYQEFREVEIRPQQLETVSPQSVLSDGEEFTEYTAHLAVEVKRLAVDRSVLSEQREPLVLTGKHYIRSEGHPPILPHQFVSPVSHRTSSQLLASMDQILEERLKPDVIKLLQLFATDVDDIELRAPHGRGVTISLHHAVIGQVPLSVEGDGMRRALAFASAVALSRDGVLLIDEIETALHPDALEEIFRFIVAACRASRVQLFVTTHSLDAVDAMLASIDESVDDIVAYRLPARSSDYPLKRFGGKTLYDLRHEGGLDPR